MLTALLMLVALLLGAGLGAVAMALYIGWGMFG